MQAISDSSQNRDEIADEMRGGRILTPYRHKKMKAYLDKSTPGAADDRTISFFQSDMSGDSKHWRTEKKKEKKWKDEIVIHSVH